MSAERQCPLCGGDMIRDGVDIGVGVQAFPWIECACGFRIDDPPPDLLPDLPPLDDDF